MTGIQQPHRYGLVIVASDAGPGIPEIDMALERGHTSRRSLGLGLPGARRLMDEFKVETDAATGTTVTMTKWRPRDELERLRERRRDRA